MDCPASAADSHIYPGSLDFPVCDITSTVSSTTAACLICLSPVQDPQLVSKLLRHSGVPMLARLRQLLPLHVAQDSPSICTTCDNLVVSIDELELQLSEQHRQLQRRHVQKAEQQDWQQAAEQVICSSGQQYINSAEPRPELQAGLLPEMPPDVQKAERHNELKSEGCSVEGTECQDKQHDETQDKLKTCRAQEEGEKHAEESAEQPAGVQATTTAENMLNCTTDKAQRPVRSTRNVKPKKYYSKPEDDPDNPDEPSPPSEATSTPAPLAAVGTDSGSATRRQAELQRRSLASLAIDRGQDRPYQCRICERRLRDRTTALRHVMSHLAERPYLCTQCPRGFVRRSSLQAHMCQHTGERPFSCHCGHAAVSAVALAAHRKAHYAAKPVRCAQCDKRFRKRSDLVVHQRAHTGERPFRCEACPRAFASASSLNAHAKKHSGAGLRCDRCSKAFEDEARLQAHRLAHDTKPFCCDQCGTQFTRATTLRRHQTRHAAPAVHRCEVCRRVFRLAAALRDHARVHTGERPFACDECDRRFALQSTLTTHQRRHTGDKPFKCELCPLAFAQATPLKRHLKTHRAEAPAPLGGAAQTEGVGEQGETLPPPAPPPLALQHTQCPAASLVTVMEAFTPVPDDRGGGGIDDAGCGGGMSGGGGSGGGGIMSGGGGGIMSSGGSGGMGDGSGGGGMGSCSAMGGGGGGSGGEVFHELQPLPPQEALRCPLCAVETTTKEEMEHHMQVHLVELEETGKASQPDLTADWQ